MVDSYENRSDLEKCVTFRKMGDSYKNGSHLEKWVTVRKKCHS